MNIEQQKTVDVEPQLPDNIDVELVRVEGVVNSFVEKRGAMIAEEREKHVTQISNILVSLGSYVDGKNRTLLNEVQREALSYKIGGISRKLIQTLASPEYVRAARGVDSH